MKKTSLLSIAVGLIAALILIYTSILRPFRAEPGVIASPDKKPLIVERQIEDMVVSDAISLQI